jgi:very-short-patch-repair endonuclease
VSPRIPIPPELSGGAFNYTDARLAGLGEGRLRGPDLARPFHGVRWATAQSLTLVDRCRAIAPNLPPGSFFSSVTAAALLTGDDSWGLQGLRVSTPDRAWCELGVQLSLPELVAAGDWLISVDAPLTTHARIGDALHRYPDRRGKAKMRAAAELLDGRAESAKESELRVILVLAGVTGLEANWSIRIANQSYRIDLAIPSRRVAIEYQGDYHRDPERWRRDMTRISRLESDSWFVIQLNADDLRDPTELVVRIRKVIMTRPFFP